ncbi:MAG: sulfide/dihydroorotate dehydrogenase-like FAD/NAD-binding protein [bacterium]|nr:sulfide/dihydroorotate dehydrogenase-like FAD/NAD-binding protein [bacterium]
MFRILDVKQLSKEIKSMVVSAPEIAKKAKPGQFIVLRIDEKGERIPLTINDFDPKTGSITIIFQEVGKTTKKLGMLEKGDSLIDVAGPLGHPGRVEKIGTVVCIGGGVGVAVIYPEARALKKIGNEVLSIIGARARDMVILEDQMRKISDELFITTDDGSYGRRGVVTDPLKDILTKRKIDLVIAIGPIIMMKFVCLMTKQFNIPTIVNLNPIMVDGTGMCGSCRVTVGGEVKFACVDGPEFDGHLVDFDELTNRNARFLDEEKESLCASGKGVCRCKKDS